MLFDARLHTLPQWIHLRTRVRVNWLSRSRRCDCPIAGSPLIQRLPRLRSDMVVVWLYLPHAALTLVIHRCHASTCASLKQSRTASHISPISISTKYGRLSTSERRSCIIGPCVTDWSNRRLRSRPSHLRPKASQTSSSPTSTFKFRVAVVHTAQNRINATILSIDHIAPVRFGARISRSMLVWLPSCLEVPSLAQL
jgi:hypothetical protein